MIRFIFRSLGLWLLAAAFIFLVYDGVRSLADSTLRVMKTGEAWHNIHSTSLQLAQAGIERHVASWLWYPVIQTVLEQPIWLVLGVLGILFMLLGRRKKPLIGYARD
jgi:hypothetical protein